MTTVTVTEQVVNVTPTETVVNVEVTEQVTTVSSIAEHGIQSSVLGTHTALFDSAGTQHLTLASDTTLGTVTSSFRGKLRVNNTMGIGLSPSVVSRLQVGVWPNLGSGSHSLSFVNIAGTQTANATEKRCFSIGGAYHLNGFNLTRFVGMAAIDLDAADDIGTSVLDEYSAFEGKVRAQSGGPLTSIISAAVFRADNPDLTNGSPVTLLAGVKIANQGDAGATTSVAVDIDSQSGAGTSLTIRAQGVAPSIHQPSLCIGANAVAGTGLVLDVTSTTGAFAVPEMTEAQRDALGAVRNGSLVYNTTAGAMNKRQGGAWVAF